MSRLPVPPITDLARVEGASATEATAWLINYYNAPDIPWNYVRGTRCVRQAYKGLHHLPSLLAGCQAEKNRIGRQQNTDVVTLAAPVAFDRATMVFDLQRQKFPFGRDLRAAYRIPFFFVEDNAVKLYFLQPRKSAALTFDQLCMVATIHKRFLLDREFYGQKSDLEYVDVSINRETKERTLTRYTLNELEMWSEKRLADHLTMVAEAYEVVRALGTTSKSGRPGRRPDPDMPLFD